MNDRSTDPFGYWVEIPKPPAGPTTLEILREIAISKLKALDESDPEGSHAKADEILCELLKSLGCADVVKEFEKLERWYS